MLLGFYPNCSVNSHSCPHQSNLSGPQRASNLDRISATRLDSKASSCGMQRSSITGYHQSNRFCLTVERINIVPKTLIHLQHHG